MRVKYGIVVVISIVFLAITLVSHVQGQNPVKYSVLAIEYTGDSDKPVAPIVISDSQAGLDWYKNTRLKPIQRFLVNLHAVDSVFLGKLITTADSFESSLHDGHDTVTTSDPLISVRVITADRETKTLYNKKSALSFLDTLKRSSRGAEGSISSQLSDLSELIQKRYADRDH